VWTAGRTYGRRSWSEVGAGKSKRSERSTQRERGNSGKRKDGIRRALQCTVLRCSYFMCLCSSLTYSYSLTYMSRPRLHVSHFIPFRGRSSSTFLNDVESTTVTNLPIVSPQYFFLLCACCWFLHFLLASPSNRPGSSSNRPVAVMCLHTTASPSSHPYPYFPFSLQGLNSRFLSSHSAATSPSSAAVVQQPLVSRPLLSSVSPAWLVP
jgi:hypothetical protein